MKDKVYGGDLSCPMCGDGKLSSEYLPPSVRIFKDRDGETVEHFGETCDVECLNCGFQFTFHTEQET